MEPDSKRLMETIRRGDSRAAVDLIDLFYERIYAFLRRLSSHDSDAADLTQRTFGRVWQALPSFAGRSSVSSWIHGIAYHRRIHSVLRTNIANDHFTVIDADAHAQSHPALFAPTLIELAQLPPHTQRCSRAAFRVLRRSKATHVAPDSHDGVANELIQRAAIAENHRSHP